MYVNAEVYRNIETGPVAILGNGPSLNYWDVTKLACPTIGINLSSDRIESEYWVTVALDRAQDVAAGKITAKKAVVTQRDIPHECLQKVIKVDMPLPDNYGKYAAQNINIFHYNLTLPLPKTFGGMLAVQTALFLGYTKIYLLGMDGGTHHFYQHCRDNIPPNYHRDCFWHVYDWMCNQQKVHIYQTNPSAVINWFPSASPPMK